MATKDKSKYSAEELSTLETKYLAGEKLTKEELIAIGETEDEKSPRDSGSGLSDIEKFANVLADVLDKRNDGPKGGKPHVPLSAEEVAKLPKKTMGEKAQEYFEGVDLKDFPWPGIHVTSDLQIFTGHVQGENSRDNHIASNPGMKFESFPKPQ